MQVISSYAKSTMSKQPESTSTSYVKSTKSKQPESISNSSNSPIPVQQASFDILSVRPSDVTGFQQSKSVKRKQETLLGFFSKKPRLNN